MAKKKGKRAKVKLVTCRKCGYNKWKRKTNKKVGRCPSCGGYNRFEALPDRRFKKPKIGKPLVPFKRRRKRKAKPKPRRRHKRAVVAVPSETTNIPEPSHEGAP